MSKLIRKKRSTALWMNLKDLICSKTLGNFEKLQIIFSAILENVTTTQLNQINIALKINKENYDAYCLEFLE